MMTVEIRRLHPGAILPEYATPGAAGVDLRAMIEKPLWLQPGEQSMMPTGIAVHIRAPIYCAKIYPRSGLSTKHGIVLANTVGIIDADYQGQIMVCLLNRSDRAYEIQPGERIAQMVLEPIERFKFVEVDEFDASERGAGGFGSTGK